MIGTLYFKDGHTEELIELTEYSDHHARFKTESGWYLYREWSEIAKNEGVRYPQYSFFKCLGAKLWRTDYTIERVEFYI